MTQLNLVALHGFTGFGGSWAPVASFSPEYNWITPDLPGHGSCRLPVTLEAALNLIDNSVGKAKPLLMGYSMGGRLAIHYAVEHADRIKGLVLIGAHPGLEDADTQAQRLEYDNSLSKSILEGGLKAFWRKWAQHPLLASQKSMPKPIKALLTKGRKQHTAEGLASALLAYSQGLLRPLWGDLHKVTCPILLVAGANDPQAIQNAQRMQLLCHQATVAIIPEAGHAAHWENMPVFTETLKKYCKTL